MMNVLIVDDEPLARERLQRLVREIPDVSVVGMAANGDEAVTCAREARPQVVLLDIRMPGRDGLSVARELAGWDEPPAVVFCTAYDEYAIDAFDAHAIGYLLKPVSREKLAQALQQARRVAPAELSALSGGKADGDAGDHAGGPSRNHSRHHISARSRRGVELLPVTEVRYFVADHKYVTVVHPGGELLIDDTLKDLEEEFGGKLLRVHRNALVALAHVQGLERVELGQYRVKLAGVSNGPLVSRRHLSMVKRQLEGC